MCSGRNPLNKNLSRLIQSALPDPPINGALFYCPGSWCANPTRHTHMSTANSYSPGIAILERSTLAIRTTENPNHHIWWNNGTYWVHYTEHLPDYTKRRVRRSLHTKDLGIARVLRDSILLESSIYEEEVLSECAA